MSSVVRDMALWTEALTKLGKVDDGADIADETLTVRTHHVLEHEKSVICAARMSFYWRK